MSENASLRLDVARLRQNYTRAGLTEAELHPDPIVQFDRWFQQSLDAGLREPNAMTLATATADGMPSARIVLLKSFDARGFVFFTNYESQKGRELLENPRAALVFHWVELERQVRIAGSVERTADQETDDYFHSRPVNSQLGAWASRQSQVIASREVLEEQFSSAADMHSGKQIPRPPDWGGYRVVPHWIEFWQGRPSRLHDRLRFDRSGEQGWRVGRLSP